MENPEKLADEEKKTKRKQQQQHTTQYVLDTTIRKQAQIK